jgi:hypothetical protein
MRKQDLQDQIDAFNVRITYLEQAVENLSTAFKSLMEATTEPATLVEDNAVTKKAKKKSEQAGEVDV